MAKPTDLPLWDTNETSTVDPGASRKSDGWLVPAGVPEKPPYQVFNHWQNNVYQWIAYFDSISSGFDPDFITGYVFESNTGTPDTQVDQTEDGDAICDDGTTLVPLSSESGINIETLFGGALGADTTYHLFSYMKDDDTVQRYVSTSLTPTIADIKSALAYRRVLSLITDSSGDIQVFHGYYLNRGLEIEYYNAGVGIQDMADTSPLATSLTNISLSVPVGLKLLARITLTAQSVSELLNFRIINLDTTRERVCLGSGAFNGPGAITYETWTSDSEWTDVLGRIGYRADKVGTSALLGLRTNGFFDPRSKY